MHYFFWGGGGGGGGWSIPFESGRRLLVLHCSFPQKSEQKKFFQKTFTKNQMSKRHSVYNNFSKKLDDLMIDEEA